jgi:hypothetical protein
MKNWFLSLLVMLFLSGFSPFANAQVTPAERTTLIAIYQQTAGDQWIKNDNWCKTAPCDADPLAFNDLGTECTWYGVICGYDGVVQFVSAIQLDSNNLAGTIPALDGLSRLWVFTMSHNSLSGPVPDLSTLSDLEWFQAFDNQLTGPIPLTGPALQDLALDNNQLSGALPTFDASPNLQRLEVAGNHLSGYLPTYPSLLLYAHLCPNLFNAVHGPDQNQYELWNRAVQGDPDVPWWLSIGTADPLEHLCDRIFADGVGGN